MKPNTSETATIRTTGEGFRPGFDCDRRIADLLRIPVEDPVPSYCDDPELTRNLLQARSDLVWERQQGSGASCVVFTLVDTLCVATAASPAHALASALLCSLEEGDKS